MNFKNKATGDVISENDFINLHASKRDAFTEVPDAPTHKVGYRDDYEEDSEGNPVLTKIGDDKKTEKKKKRVKLLCP